MPKRTILSAMLITGVIGTGSIGCGSKKQTMQTAQASPTVASTPTAAPAVSDRSIVAISCAVENVSAGLKAGDSVTLQMVLGKTVMNGHASYNTSDVVKNANVVSVKTDPKPASPDQAVNVQVAVAKDDVARIEEIKSHTAMMNECSPDGTFTTTRKPVPLRLVLNK